MNTTQQTRLCVLVMALVAVTGSAHADIRDQATAAGRYEVKLGGQLPIYNDARFADEEAKRMINFAAGYYVVRNTQVSLVGATDLFAGSADAYEVTARVTRYARLPIVRGFAGLGAGYYWLEVRGSDYSFDDRGFRGALDLGFRLAIPRRPGTSVFIEPTFQVSFLLSHSIHNARNSSFPAWTQAVVGSVAIPISI